MAKAQEWITEEGCSLVKRWARIGLTNKQIAQNMGISNKTFYGWLKKYDELDKAFKEGRAQSIETLEDALYKRAVGFRDEDGKYYPPDTGAAIFLLKNWNREFYSNKPMNSTELRELELSNLTKEAQIRLMELEKKIKKLEIKKLENELETNDSDNGIREALEAAAKVVWSEEELAEVGA